jgi:broad specificity phosphatase PhoE
VREILLARHGETERSRDGRRPGAFDAVYRQRHRARQVGAAAVSEFSIDALYLSHLGRTTATAAFYGDSLGPQATILRDLHEVNRRGRGGLTKGTSPFDPGAP